MKLSFVLELLLIFVLLAFAASKNIKREKNNRKNIQNKSDEVKQDADDNGINKYCKCSEALCTCCRDFNVPLVNLDGPGCASLMYLLGDRMSVSLKFGNRLITNRTLSGRKPSPVCMPLPGGISKFCGRVYNIARSGEDFRACLGLELQSKNIVEATTRVSCFKFGPKGVNAEAADPLPLVPQDEQKDDDDDDDDDEDDDFGLGGDDDDDEDDDDDSANDVDGVDYTGFSLLGDDILGDLFGTSGGKKSNKNKKKQAPTSTTTTTTTTKRPKPSRRPTRRTTTPRPQRTTTVKARPTTRKPNRRRTTRPNRRSTTPIPISVYPVTSQDVVSSQITNNIQTQYPTTEHNVISDSTSEEHNMKPVLLTIKPASTESSTLSSQQVTNLEDPGLQMSLAHITGQLSEIPVTSMDRLRFEKIETITPKSTATRPYSLSPQKSSIPEISDDMVEIVQTLDSQSSERVSTFVESTADEARGQLFNNYYMQLDNGADLPKKRNRKNNNNNDYDDVLGLTAIGESIMHGYDSLANSGKKKNNGNKVGNERKRGNDYDDLFGIQAISESLGLNNENKKKNSNKKNKEGRRRNKMMRGEWSS